jgi:hypothetical protein
MDVAAPITQWCQLYRFGFLTKIDLTNTVFDIISYHCTSTERIGDAMWAMPEDLAELFRDEYLLPYFEWADRHERPRDDAYAEHYAELSRLREWCNAHPGWPSVSPAGVIRDPALSFDSFVRQRGMNAEAYFLIAREGPGPFQPLWQEYLAWRDARQLPPAPKGSETECAPHSG